MKHLTPCKKHGTCHLNLRTKTEFGSPFPVFSTGTGTGDSGIPKTAFYYYKQWISRGPRTSINLAVDAILRSPWNSLLIFFIIFFVWKNIFFSFDLICHSVGYCFFNKLLSGVLTIIVLNFFWFLTIWNIDIKIIMKDLLANILIFFYELWYDGLERSLI